MTAEGLRCLDKGGDCDRAPVQDCGKINSMSDAKCLRGRIERTYKNRRGDKYVISLD